MTLSTEVVVAVIGALATAITAGVTRVYLDMRRDRDFWRDIALRLSGNNAAAIEVARKAAKPDVD